MLEVQKVPTKLDMNVRLKRASLVVLSLYLGYWVLEYLLNIKIANINYLIYPCAIYVCFNILFSSNSGPQDGFVNKISYLDYLKSFSQIIILLIIFTIIFAVLLGLFLGITLADDSAVNSINAELSSVLNYYLAKIWLIVPWPMILGYVSLHMILVQRYQLNNINDLANQIWPRAIKNDTINNIILIFHSFPFLASTCIATAIAAYIGYISVCKLLGLTWLHGVTLFSLGFMTLSFLLLLRANIKNNFRAMNYHRWSIAKFLMITTIILLIWLLIPTLLISLLSKSPDSYLWGKHNYFIYRLDVFYVYLISSLWWFCFPLVGIACYRKLQLNNNNAKLNMILLILAFVVAGLIITQLGKLIAVSQFNIFPYLQFGLVGHVIILLFILGGLYKLFAKEFDKDLIMIGYLSKSSEDKFRAASKTYYLIFLIIAVILMMMTLENVFLLQKFIAFGSIANSLLFLMLLRGYLRLVKNS